MSFTNMTTKVFTLIFFIAWATISNAQTDKPPCRDINFLVTKTVDAINNRDANAYLSLIDFDAMLNMLGETSAKDTTVKKLYEQMKTRKELFTMMYQASFSELTEQIEKDLKTSKWTIKLSDFYTERKEEDPINVHHTLIVKIKANGKKYHLMMYASKFHDCYYIFEPMAPYFTSGW